MSRAMEGTCLAALVRMAIPVCQAAERQCPRTGPGRPPEYHDWQVAVLIMVAILKRRKSKSAQYRFLHQYQTQLCGWLALDSFPARSTYFERYRGAHGLFDQAIRLQGLKAIGQGIADASTVAVDKSVVRARGPQWHHRDRRRGVVPKGLRGVDRDSTWTFCEHHGWVQGYSYEVVVSGGKQGVVFPLVASADTANVSEHLTFGSKIEQLPSQTNHVLADAGYDNTRYTDQVEYDARGQPNGRRFICPPNRRNTQRRAKQSWPRSKKVVAAQQRRHRRTAYTLTRRGQQLYARRGQTVEPFNDWFKELFELDNRAWHRGLGNNRTQLLGGICSYQLLVRYNHRRQRRNGQIRWIVDTL